MTSVWTDVPPISQNQTMTLPTMIAIVTTGNVFVGTLSRSGIMRCFLPDHERQQGLLGMKTVLGLVPDGRPRPVQDALGDLLAVMRGQAMEHDHFVVCPRNELGVDAVAGEVAEPALALLLLAHRRPDVGVEDVGACRSGVWIVDELDRAAGLARDPHRLLVGPVAGRGRRDEVHP